MKSSTYLFHVKTQILADFQICISAPLNCDGVFGVAFEIDGLQISVTTGRFQL